MRRLRNLLFAVALCGLGAAFVPSVSVSAAVTCPTGSVRPSAPTYAECNLPADAKKETLFDSIKNAINVILGVLGVVAVVVIILGGFTFMTSQGDAGKVMKGRNTILWGVIGLAVALLAFAIVNFVLTGVFGNTSTGGGGDGSGNHIEVDPSEGDGSGNHIQVEH